jgi:dsRNA-specific ribonuclease
MVGNIFMFLIDRYGQDFDNEKIQEALTYSKNRSLAEIGDSVLDLVILEKEYRNPDSDPKSLDDLRQFKGKRKKNQEILAQDTRLTNYLLKRDYTQNPQGKIGVRRSDQYMEAIIGAVYLTCGLPESWRFIEEIYDLRRSE